jgi:hypothetical protein
MRRIFLVVVGVISAAVALHAQRPAAPSLEALVRAGATYVQAYASRVSGTTTEELMLLSEVTGSSLTPPRRLSSDVVLVRTSEDGRLAGLRDLYAIDTRPVRERLPRIVTALVEPTIANWQRAQSHAREHAAYLGHQVVVSFSDPVLALQFITEGNQPRITYKIEGNKRMNDTAVVGVGFKEQVQRGRPVLLDTTEGHVASGRFWIDPVTGAIHQTELWLQSDAETTRLRVSFSPDSIRGVLLPTEASGTFEWREPATAGNIGRPGRRLTLESMAKYSNPRYTPVDVSRIHR